MYTNHYDTGTTDTTSMDRNDENVASIQLPNTLFNSDIVKNSTVDDRVGLVFTYFETTALFPLRNGTRLVNTSSVIGALVGGTPSITDIREPVTVTLRIPTSEVSFFPPHKHTYSTSDG